MSGISHKQAIRLIQRRLDGLLNQKQLLSLDEHLRSCDDCSAYAAEMDLLPLHLRHEFHARWDKKPGPSQKVLEYVTTKVRNIPMSSRISSGFRMFASVGTMLVLAFLVNFVISQLRNTSPATPAVNNLLSSNGRLIAFASKANGNSDIYTIQSDGSKLSNLTNNPAEDVNPVWSPDGKRIAFVSNRDGNNNIYVMNFDGSNLIRLTDDPLSDTVPLWSPDGTKIAYQSGSYSNPINTNIYVVDTDGQNRRRLTNYVPNTTVWPEAWSPDSQFILFEVSRQIVQVGINDRMVTPLTPQTDVYVPSNFVLSADGSKLTYLAECDEHDRGSNDFCNTVKTVNRYATNEETKATLKIQEVCSLKQPTTWMGWFTKWSPDQTKLMFAFTCNDNGWLYIANADGSDFKPLTNYPILGDGPQNEVVTFDWSPDNQFVVFMSALDSLESESLYILNVDDALQNPELRPTRVNTSISQVMSPAWQPLSNDEIADKNPTPEPTSVVYQGLIAFASESKNVSPRNMDIFTMRADGNDITNITNNPANDYDPTWSPNGNQITFVSERTGNPDIFVMDADGSNVVRLTDNSGYDGFFSWSPDGQKIVYLSSADNDPNVAKLMIMNADGSNKIALTKTPDSYIFESWSPDAQKVIYLKQNLDPNANAATNDVGTYIINVDGSNQRHLQAGGADKIHWSDTQHFYGVGGNAGSGDGITQPSWTIYKSSTDGTLPLKLASYGTPIVAVFDKTYIVEGQNALVWYSFDSNATSVANWDFSTICNEPGDRYLDETTHAVSSDEKYAFGTLYCMEGRTWFYLEKTDGSEIKQLSFYITKPRQVMSTSWSPDGKHILLVTADADGGYMDLYRFDVEKILNDPATQPVQLTTNGMWRYGYEAVWQPSP